jgi:hypothetical protein
LQAEWVITMYVLFLFMMFPMLDFAVLGLRAFFLWFACDQAAMVGCKAHSLVTPVTIGTQTYLGAINLSANRAFNVVQAFPGTTITGGYPQIYVIFSPLNPSNNNPVNYGPLTISTASSPISSIPNMNNYVVRYQCVMAGTVLPFIPIPLIGNIPGLSTPAQLTFVSSAVFENPPGLAI